MIRYFNTKVSKDCLPKMFFELFPNIETIETHGGDSLQSIANSDIIQKIKQLVAKREYGYKNIPYAVSSKIVSLCFNLNCSSGSLDFEKLPNLKRIKVECDNPKELLAIQKSLKTMNLEKVIIITDCISYDTLKTFSEIKNKVIRIKESRYRKIGAKQIIDQLKPINNVYLEWLDGGVSINNCYISGNISLNETCDINDIYKNCAFSKCWITGKCDLRKCELLEKIYASTNRKSNVLVEGLSNLKYISNVQSIDVIPLSVTELSLDSDFNFKEFVQQQKTRFGDEFNCFNNIKTFHLDIKQNSYIVPKFPAMFIGCDYMAISNSNFKQWFDLPTSLTKLYISYNYNKKQVIEIGKLKKLKSLLLTSRDANKSFLKFVDYNVIQDTLNKLPELEYIYTNLYDDSVTIPSTVTNLELVLFRNINLNKYTSLKIIELCHSPHKQEIHVVLPTKLDSLRIGKKIFVDNSYEIEINNLILPTIFRNLVPNPYWNAQSIEYEDYWF